MQERESAPGPSFAEHVRTLLQSGRTALLSTVSAKFPGFPFGSLAPYGVRGNGQPTFLLSALAVHTRNLGKDGRASLFVSESPADDGSGDLSVRRATLLGSVAPVPEVYLDDVRADYLERHDDARRWVDFGDFRFFELEPVAIYFVGGFGSMGWIDPADYAAAVPDPLAESAAMIRAHMNADHADALLLYCRAYANVPAEDATLTQVDRLGFCIRARTATESRTLRIPFPEAVTSPDEARKAFVKMVRAARAGTASA